MAAAIPAAIGAIGSIVGGSLANKASGVPSASTITQPLMQGQGLGLSNAQQLMPQGTSLMTGAAQALNPVLNYYAPLLAGNRGAMTQVLAPEINQLNQAYQTQAAAQNALMPRGGGRATLMSQMPYQQQASILNLYQNARNQAAAGMGQAAGQLGQMGAGLIGAANQSLYASTAAGQNLLNYQLQQQQQNRALGSSIGGMLQSGLTDWLAGRGGSEGTPGIAVTQPTIPNMSNPANWPTLPGGSNIPNTSVWNQPAAPIATGQLGW